MMQGHYIADNVDINTKDAPLHGNMTPGTGRRPRRKNRAFSVTCTDSEGNAQPEVPVRKHDARRRPAVSDVYRWNSGLCRNPVAGRSLAVEVSVFRQQEAREIIVRQHSPGI